MSEHTVIKAKYNYKDSEMILTRKYLTQPQSETTTTDRFDLEEKIMRCWQIVDDLDDVIEIIEDDKYLTNLVVGIKSLYDVKFKNLWETFENSIKK
jgi:hypothetical protein